MLCGFPACPSSGSCAKPSTIELTPSESLVLPTYIPRAFAAVGPRQLIWFCHRACALVCPREVALFCSRGCAIFSPWPCGCWLSFFALYWSQAVALYSIGAVGFSCPCTIAVSGPWLCSVALFCPRACGPFRGHCSVLLQGPRAMALGQNEAMHMGRRGQRLC